MKKESTFIIHPSNTEQVSALKAFLKSLKIQFEIKSDDESYNPEFVEKVKESKKQFDKGDYTFVKKDELKNFLGL